MPWRGVTVSEQRQRFLEDYQLNYYPVTELAERFGISRKTAYPGLTTSLPWQSRGQASGSGGSRSGTLNADLTLYYCEVEKASLCLIDQARLRLPLTVGTSGESSIALEYRIPEPKTGSG